MANQGDPDYTSSRDPDPDPIKLARDALEQIATRLIQDQPGTAGDKAASVLVQYHTLRRIAHEAIAALDAIPQPAPVPDAFGAAFLRAHHASTGVVPGDAELDEIVRDLSHTGELSMLYRCAIADALTALRTRLADVEADAAKARRFRDIARREAVEHCDRADRLERELAAALAGAAEVRELVQSCEIGSALYVAKDPMWARLNESYGWMFPPHAPCYDAATGETT